MSTTKSTEYEIVFGNVAAERGWTDLKATAAFATMHRDV